MSKTFGEGLGPSVATEAKLYSCVIRVDLWTPIPPADPDEVEDKRPVIGYIRVLRVRAASEAEAKLLVEQVVTDGAIDWDQSEWRIISLEDLERDLRENGLEIGPAPIVHQSGRIFFHEE